MAKGSDTGKKPAPKSSSPEIKLAYAKLESSGLDLKDMVDLGMEVLGPFSTGQLHETFAPKTALKINYFDLAGEPLKPRPNWPAFYRIRYLEDVDDPASSFAGSTEKKKLRYTNEPEAGIAAYFPKSVDWFDVAADAMQPIIITEGELKAAKACKEGFPTIGLGGVYNFRSVRNGIPFLPELEEIDWVKRYVYICYDSDYRTNSNICIALNQLAEELVDRGAIPMLLSLPDLLEEGKTGLDDLLVTAPQASEMLRQLLRQAEPLGLSRPLWQLNEQVIYIQDPGLLVKRKNHQKLSPAAFRDHAYSTLSYTEQTVRNDGEMSYKKVPAAASWLKWPLRSEASKLVYTPGQPEMVETSDGNCFNVWPGWGCVPKKGDLKLWNKLLDHLFTDAEKEARVWFERWLAYPLQHPGTKLYSAVVFHGIFHGTGKSLIGFMMGRIYGKNFAEISKDMLESGSNDWAEAKQFVLGDEVTGSSKREFNDRLKKMITQERMRINIKYVPQFDIMDYINYFFTSNHPDAFFMEDNERRYFIHEVKVKPLDDEFYQEFDEWMKRGEGPSALFHYLLNLNLGDFNPRAPALKTRAMARMIQDTKSDLGEWVRRLMDDPDTMLKVGHVSLDKDLFTNRELLAIYDPEQRTGTTANGLGRELRRSGVPLAYDGNPLPGPTGADRFYIVRNQDTWLFADRKSIVKHIDSTQKKRKVSKKY